MKKRHIIIAFAILLILLFAIFNVLKNNKDTIQEVSINDEHIFEYNSNMSILPFQNTFLIYDGKRLVKKNEAFKDIFSLRLNISDFVMKTSKENVYILDKIEKILYKISKDGEIVNQVKFIENAQNIYPLKNSDILLQYNTSVNTDGIIVYDSDLRKKKNINYPNALVHTVMFEEGTNDVFISVQMINNTDIINAIYWYNSKYDVQLINQYKNLVTIGMDLLNGQKLILDPNTVYIMDSHYKNLGRISAQASFEKMVVNNEHIYLQDGSKTVRIFDKTGKLVKDIAFKDPLIDILKNLNQVIYVTKSEVRSDRKVIKTQKDIEEAILLSNNKLVLFFRGGVKIVDIPY